MNRNEKFYLVMAIFYTVLCAAVLYIVFSMRLYSLMGFLIILLAGLCTGSQWLRYRRARDRRRGVVRQKRIPKFVPMPDKMQEAKTESAEAEAPAQEEKHEAD